MRHTLPVLPTHAVRSTRSTMGSLYAGNAALFSSASERDWSPGASMQ